MRVSTGKSLRLRHFDCGVNTIGRDRMKLPRRTISASGRGRCRAAGRVAHREGAEPIRRGRCASSSALPPAARVDIFARLMGQWLSERLGQPFIVENRPGAGSNIATEAVVQAPAGRLHAPPGQCGERNQRDALREAQFQFHPRHRAGRGHHPRAPSSWRYIHRFRPRRCPSSSPMPKPIRARSTWRRPAIGAPSHVAGELFKMMAGVNMVHVPYRGAAPALTDLLGGQVQVYFDPMPRRSSTSGPASCARWR